MQYMLLIYSDESSRALFGTEASNLAYGDFTRSLIKSGHMIAGEALQDSHTAVTVSVRKDKIRVVQGAFAKTKEQLGGYYLIEAENMKEAQSIAAKIPTATIGRVEIRPIMLFKN